MATSSVQAPIPGMESVIATVSGYHGSQRFNLIKLISHAGGFNVGYLNNSVTHLVHSSATPIGLYIVIAMRL